MNQNTTPNDAPLLDSVDVARQLGVAAHTVRFWRQNGKGPAFVRVTAGCIRYRQSAVDAYIAANTVQPEASA